MPDVAMPRLTDAMREGTIVRWLRADGDAVQPGDELAEIATAGDRATFEAEAGGVLRHLAREGDTVALGVTIATITADNAAPVVTADAPPAATPAATKKGDVAVEELTRGQQVAARRVAEARALVPELAVWDEADMEQAVALLAELHTEHGDAAPDSDDLVVRAAALALRDVPRANGAYRDGHWERYGRVNVGIAVATGTGLAVPTLFDADRRTLLDLAADRRALVERAHAGVLTQPEQSGATFTVSSIAATGTAGFQPIITTGQAAVIGVGAVRPAVLAVDGAPVVRPACALTLVADHRILYGPDAGALLARIRALLEAPAALV